MVSISALRTALLRGSTSAPLTSLRISHREAVAMSDCRASPVAYPRRSGLEPCRIALRDPPLQQAMRSQRDDDPVTAGRHRL